MYAERTEFEENHKRIEHKLTIRHRIHATRKKSSRMTTMISINKDYADFEYHTLYCACAPTFINQPFPGVPTATTSARLPDSITAIITVLIPATPKMETGRRFRVPKLSQTANFKENCCQCRS